MVSFIHIEDKKQQALILKNGLRATKRAVGSGGVYAVPVVPNYATTHQWSRELKRRGARSLVCVQFRIPSDEQVFVGKYNAEKVEMTASDAASAFRVHADAMGLEVVIPRRILPAEITRSYDAPRLTGWRYHPEAKGKKPFCHCKYCNRGEIRAQRLIEEED